MLSVGTQVGNKCPLRWSHMQRVSAHCQTGMNLVKRLAGDCYRQRGVRYFPPTFFFAFFVPPISLFPFIQIYHQSREALASVLGQAIEFHPLDQGTSGERIDFPVLGKCDSMCRLPYVTGTEQGGSLLAGGKPGRSMNRLTQCEPK